MTERKRLGEYDLVRITLMLMLPIIHVVQYWGYVCGGADLIVHKDVDNLYPLVQLALYFTAPCFMIMMGINMLFTRHDTANNFFCRGILLLCLEIVFNIVRYIVPAFIGFLLGEYNPEVMEYAIFGLFNSDILAFAGFAFIVMAGFKILKLSADKVLLVSLVIWGIGLIVSHLAAPGLNEHLGVGTLNILGSFVWVNADSNFPLSCWIIFPAIGYAFNDCLKKAETNSQKEKIWRLCTIAGLLIMALAICIAKLLDIPFYETFSVNGAEHLLMPQVVLFGTATTFFLIGICHYLAPLIQREAYVEKIVTRLGGRLTEFYLIQWTIIGWGLFITGGTNLWRCQQLTLWQTIISIIAIEIISALLSTCLSLWHLLAQANKPISHVTGDA